MTYLQLQNTLNRSAGIKADYNSVKSILEQHSELDYELALEKAIIHNNYDIFVLIVEEEVIVFNLDLIELIIRYKRWQMLENIIDEVEFEYNYDMIKSVILSDAENELIDRLFEPDVFDTYIETSTKLKQTYKLLMKHRSQIAISDTILNYTPYNRKLLDVIVPSWIY